MSDDVRTLSDDALGALLDEHAPPAPCALAPAIRAWHARDEVPLWAALEHALGRRVDAPFFCVAWPGAQALARTVLDGSALDVRGRVVADLGCGSGVAAVAAMLAGASRVLAVDVDPLATQSARILAARHGVVVEPVTGDALAHAALVDDADVILAGDLVYSATQLAAFRACVAAWTASATTSGVTRASRRCVVLADSGRPFFDPCGLPCIAAHAVAVPRGVDAAAGDQRIVRVYASPWS